MSEAGKEDLWQAAFFPLLVPMRLAFLMGTHALAQLGMGCCEAMRKLDWKCTRRVFEHCMHHGTCGMIYSTGKRP